MEFDFIDCFAAPFRPPSAPQGPGDDCAVLELGKGCLTTDAVVEGVHFTLETSSLEDVGHKALAVNLSDLAAMGARPRGFLCALTLPRSFGAAQVVRLARGMAPLARAHQAALWGGNFSQGPVLSLTVTAFGDFPKGRAPLLRSGARAGDRLYVSGSLGDAALGLRALAAGQTRGALVQRQRRPTPQVKLGRLASGYARAALDLSDGLAQDLGHLCQSSRVGARVNVSALPVSAAAVRAARGRAEAQRWALRGGEDYELLLAVPPVRAAAFERACKQAGERVTHVGTCTRVLQVCFEDAAGRAVDAPFGFDHFRIDS